MSHFRDERLAVWVLWGFSTLAIFVTTESVFITLVAGFMFGVTVLGAHGVGFHRGREATRDEQRQKQLEDRRQRAARRRERANSGTDSGSDRAGKASDRAQEA